jgi:peptide/nickel transport system substrate-binding protein
VFGVWDEPNTCTVWQSQFRRSVLSAIYDGPMDVVEYGYEPIILEKIPSLEDGDAQISPVSVSAGAEIVDTTGNVVLLNTGTRVRPSGCRSDDCAIAYDGSSTLQMDQLVVFTCSKDSCGGGAPLSSDSFSFRRANDATWSSF